MSESLESNKSDREKGNYYIPPERLQGPQNKVGSLPKDCIGWLLVQMVFILYGWSWYKWCDDLRPHCGNLSVLN